MTMTINQNDEVSGSKSLNASEDSYLLSWSDLNHDLLLPIMMELGPVDFFAFGGACKSWRSLALPHLKKFMGSRRPMSVTFSTGTTNECCLEDFEGRKFKTVLPHSTGSTCVGVTCGFLIFFRREPCEFWLVNPFTRRELHFPNFPVPDMVNTNPSIFRGVLFFSSFTFQWVFVFSHKFTDIISYSASGNQASWKFFSFSLPIFDIHSFNGKIYTITNGSRVVEVRLDPTPSMTLLGMKNFPPQGLLRPEFVDSGKNLYVVSCIQEDVYEAYEMDFEKMEYVPIEKSKVKCAFFLGDLKSGAAVDPDTWADRRMQFERLGYLKDGDKSKMKGRCLTADMWYLPRDCFNVNPPQ